MTGCRSKALNLNRLRVHDISECAAYGGRLRIIAALNDIDRAGNMDRLAREAGMSRKGLYKALSEVGNPTFATVMRITRALGMHLRITA